VREYKSYSQGTDLFRIREPSPRSKDRLIMAPCLVKMIDTHSVYLLSFDQLSSSYMTFSDGIVYLIAKHFDDEEPF